MNEKITDIFLDLKSKLNANYQILLDDTEFMQHSVDSLIAMSKRAVKAGKDEEHKSMTPEEKVASRKKFQNEVIEEQFDLLRPVFEKVAPLKLEAAKIMSTLEVDEFFELSFALGKEEARRTIDFTNEVMQKAQPRLFDELDAYADELDDLEEGMKKEAINETLRIVRPDELVN